MDGKIMVLVASVAIGVAAQASEPQATPPAAGGPVGRYQICTGLLPNMESRIFVVDTITGQCWSKSEKGKWHDEGNPARGDGHPSVRPSPDPATILEDPAEMTIIQRREEAVPGFDGKVLVRLGDITGGQVLLSVVTEEGKTLVDSVSVSPGDTVRFGVKGRAYLVRLKEVRNLLVGNDFATLTVERAIPKRDAAGDDGTGARRN